MESTAAEKHDTRGTMPRYMSKGMSTTNQLQPSEAAGGGTAGDQNRGDGGRGGGGHGGGSGSGKVVPAMVRVTSKNEGTGYRFKSSVPQQAPAAWRGSEELQQPGTHRYAQHAQPQYAGQAGLAPIPEPSMPPKLPYGQAYQHNAPQYYAAANVPGIPNVMNGAQHRLQQTARPPPFMPTVPHGRPQNANFAPVPSTNPPVIFRMGENADQAYAVLHSVDDRPTVRGIERMSLGVHLVHHIQSGNKFVMKQISTDDQGRKERAIAEVAALMQIRKAGGSYNINFIVDHVFYPVAETCTMILEFCDRETVAKAMDKYQASGQPIEEAFIWHVLAGMTRALCMTHHGIDVDNVTAEREVWNCICHLDIKPGNLLFTNRQAKGQYPRVVLGDFGCAVTKADIDAGKEDRRIQTRGTVGWFPPENVRAEDGKWKGRYGMPTDIWQAGAVAQTMCWLSSLPDMKHVEKGMACGRMYSKELNKIVGWMMYASPFKRPTALDLAIVLRIEMQKFGQVF